MNTASKMPSPDSPGGHHTRATRWGSMVTGADDGAAIEKNTPFRSMRVEGPGASRRLNPSTNTAETISIVIGWKRIGPVGLPHPPSNGDPVGVLGSDEHDPLETDFGQAEGPEDGDRPPSEIDLPPPMPEAGRRGGGVMVVVPA